MDFEVLFHALHSGITQEHIDAIANMSADEKEGFEYDLEERNTLSDEGVFDVYAAFDSEDIEAFVAVFNGRKILQYNGCWCGGEYEVNHTDVPPFEGIFTNSYAVCEDTIYTRTNDEISVLRQHMNGETMFDKAYKHGKVLFDEYVFSTVRIGELTFLKVDKLVILGPNLVKYGDITEPFLALYNNSLLNKVIIKARYPEHAAKLEAITKSGKNVLQQRLTTHH